MSRRTMPRVTRALALTGLLILLAACGTGAPAPTATPDWPTPLPPLPVSPTVNPVAPVEEGPEIHDPALGAPGVSNPTQAGLAAEGQPEHDLPTITPPPPQSLLPMVISGADGLIMYGTLYAAVVRPAPGLLLVHMQGRDRSSWEPLPARLQAAGYAVLAIDLRGYGETGGVADWTRAPADVRAALAQFAGLPGISGGQLAVIGASIGANLGLNACADQPGCAAAVLLSPGLDIRGITAADALARFGARPVLIVASETDENNPADSVTLDSMAGGDHQLLIYPAAAGHGTDMLVVQPDLIDAIVNWLVAHLPPPGG